MEPSAAEPTALALSDEPSTPRALVVLADAAEARLLGQWLSAQGCDVEHVPAPGDAAEGQPGREGSDLVFIDAATVGSQGPGACRQARQRWLPQGGALFICGHPADEVQAQAALREGASDWLRPPLGAGEFAARLQPHVELARLRRLTAQQQRQLKALQDALQAQEPLATLGMLGTSLAHEVSNPNNFVQLSAENLRDELGRFRAHLDTLLDADADPEIRADFARRFERLEQHLGLVRDGCRQIAAVVQAMRPHARTGAEATDDIDVAEVLERSVRLVKVAFGQAVRFELDLRDRAPVRCSPGPVQQVCVNLLVNACQAIEARAADEGSREPGVVRAVSRLQAGHLRLGIVDNGCGMSDEVRQRLFEPFFTTKDAARGTGLGMGICRDIVQGLGGGIEVRSEPGKGTEIWLNLPVADGGGR